MRTSLLCAICFLLGAVSIALAATTGIRPEVFISRVWSWTAFQSTTCVALTDAATITVDASKGQCFTVTVSANNHTLGAPSNLQAGAFNVQITNSGGATGFAVNSVYKFPNGTLPSWSSTNNAIDVLSCTSFDGSTLKCVGLINES